MPGKMTESEAKVILESEYKFHGECSVFGEALEIAIQALEKQEKIKDLLDSCTAYPDDVCEPSADKIKVTSLEVIVTGKREKPYYEIKYKEVGEIDYKIGYSSYDLNNVFAWRDEFFEIVNHK